MKSYRLLSIAICQIMMASAYASVDTQVTNPTVNIDKNALPMGEQVKVGDADISRNNSAMTITQKSQLNQIDWDSFNIGQSASVTFKQPNQESISYNRVTGNDISQIQGKLSANGRVFLSNPNGVLFTKNAQVNVGALLATTKNAKDFNENSMNITFGGDSTASIINEGNITSQDGVVLIANTAINKGKIEITGDQQEYLDVKQRQVWDSKSRQYINKKQINGIKFLDKNATLAAADSFTLRLENFQVELTPIQVDALIKNEGLIISKNHVYLTAKGADTVKNLLVNNDGIIEADSVHFEGNKVVFGANSDIRYATTGQTGSQLTIIQNGEGEGHGVDIGGKITAKLDLAKAKEKARQHNERIGQGGVYVDKEGKSYYVDGEKILSVTKESNGYVDSEGKVYAETESGTIVINGNSYADSTANISSIETVDVLGSNGLQNLITIDYTQKNGQFDKLVVKPVNITDPVNQKIAQAVQEKINQKDYSILDYKTFNSFVQPIIEAEKQKLIKTLGINDEQMKLLTEPQTVKETKISSVLLSNVNKLATDLGKDVNDIKLLASLLNNRRKVNYGVSNPKSAYRNDEGKELQLFELNKLLAKPLQKSVSAPLVTINHDGDVNVKDATFDQENSRSNIVFVVNKDKSPNISFENVEFDLGSGGVGIGRQNPSSQVSYKMKLVDGNTQKPLIAVNYYGRVEKQGSVSDILEAVTTSDVIDDITVGQKADDDTLKDISVKQLLDIVKEDKNAFDGINYEGQSFYQVFKEAINNVAKKNGITINQEKFNSLYDDGSNYSGGRIFLLGKGMKQGKNTIKLSSVTETKTIKGITNTKLEPYQVSMKNVDIKNTGELAITGGFKKVDLDNIQTDGNTNTYIHAGNTRSYTTQESSNSPKVKATAYEYGIDDIKERITRADNAGEGNRWRSERENLLSLETNSFFDGWHASKEQGRAHLDSEISIKDSHLKTNDGFLHLMAKKLV